MPVTRRRSTPFDHWSTGTKLLLLLTLALFPLGLALAWTARSSLQDVRDAQIESALEEGKVAAQIADGLIVRNSIALRIAANAALRSDPAAPCDAVARALVLTPSIANRFAIRDTSAKLICTHGDFGISDNDAMVAPGASRAWVFPAGPSILFRVGVNGGMVTGELTDKEFARAVREAGRRVHAMAILDNQLTLPVIPAAADWGGTVRQTSYPISGGQLNALVTTRVGQSPLLDRQLVFLPLLMWAVAAFLSWYLVRRLLLLPLGRLERAVADYQPGEGSLVIPKDLGSADEIHSLGSAFERAVDRLESSEQQMAEALHGQRRLVREVHHRVKNNLQVIASMLNIHGRSATTPESRAAYAAISRRVDALSVVHRNHFAEVEESRGIALRPLLTELGQILRASAPENAPSVKIHLEADSVHTTQDAAVAVAFFVTELIEFALLQGAAAPIEIELRRIGELAASLTVSSDALVPGAEPPTIERQQFERVVAGLARQLRSPLDQKLGRMSVNLAVFPD